MPNDKIEKQNPPKYELLEDLANMTYLSEASVVYNLSGMKLLNESQRCLDRDFFYLKLSDEFCKGKLRLVIISISMSEFEYFKAI